MSVIDLNLLSNHDRGTELSIEPAPEVQTEEDTSDDDRTIRKWKDAIDKEPLNYWLWHNLCRLHVATTNLDGAIHACELRIKKSDANPSPLMELTNLYAAKGDYKASITTGMWLLKIKPHMVLLALTDSKDSSIISTSSENKLKSSLEP
jgi:hypothetical protein